VARAVLLLARSRIRNCRVSGRVGPGRRDLAYTEIADTLLEITMKKSFKEALQALVDHRIAAGDDPEELFEELRREANLVFGHYNLEYELGLFTKTKDPE
jgi:hypothetical protein